MGAAERIRVRLSGAVQGVGMRPFVHRLARDCGLSGFVRNGADGVTIEVEGPRIAEFLARLSAEAPPLATIDSLGIDTLAPSGETGFTIRESTGGPAATRIVPDAATCPACLEDLFNPRSRFFGYPFVNCTHCGPRYTITRRLPYDRVNTSMAGFAMCPACAADYADPANRRFHAEPIACPVCGPRLQVRCETVSSSWPGLARPSTTGDAETRKVVAGRAKPGHDTGDDRFRHGSWPAGGAGTAMTENGSSQRMTSHFHKSAHTDTFGHDKGKTTSLRPPPAASGLGDDHAAGSDGDRSVRHIPPIAVIAAAICAGAIVALKGIGGFHLLCDARNETAVAVLRQRKGREAKPFAVMVASIDALTAIANPTDAETALASSTARPVVLMDMRPDVLAPSVSPGLSRLGVMLAYAPVHHLLFAELGGSFALVATSANPGGEPLVIDNDDAERRLAGIADMIVTHDRAILIRADDSVAQVIAGAPALLRRARGYVPEPIALADDGPVVLALGAHLKSTVTITRGREAFVSQHIGDLDTAETVRFWRETIDHLLGILDVRPEVIACDLHPDYLSSRMAEDFGLPVVRIQHHAAHIAAIAAEHHLAGPVLGLALDGHGFGGDGGAWGGEMMVVDGAAWRRIGQLAPLPLPGGDRAAREPWRMGVAALHAAGRGSLAARFPDRKLAGPLAARLAAGAEPIATSSLGRLFDAVAALLGLHSVQTYEGQAAMELEALVRTPRALPGGWTRDAGGLPHTDQDKRSLEKDPAIRTVPSPSWPSPGLSGGSSGPSLHAPAATDGPDKPGHDGREKVLLRPPPSPDSYRPLSFAPLLAAFADAPPDPRTGAELFHGTLIEGLAAMAEAGTASSGLSALCLGGGCMMNRVLAEGLAASLSARGLTPVLARRLPPNDGGLSLGQAVMARLTVMEGN